MDARNLLTLATLVALSGTLAAASSWDNALSLSNVTVSPNPVVAGANATIKFQLYNSYGSWVNNVNLQPTGSYPILNVSPRSVRNIGQVNSGLNLGFYNYTFAVPASTSSGTYTITFLASYYALGSSAVVATSTMPLSFYVQNKPAIRVIASSAQPSALYAGYNQTLTLSIQNVGFGTARNVTVTVTPQQGVSLLSSVSTFFIANLTQGSSITEPVLVSAQNVGQAGLVASVAYSSSNFNQRFSSIQTVNLSIAPAAQFTISSIGPGVGPGATDVPVRYIITNTGTSTATQLQLSLQTSYPITPVASSAYVDSLNPGASTNVTFLVNIDTSGVPGNYPVTVFEQWKQPNGAVNQQFSGSNNNFLPVSSTGGSLLTIAVVAVIIVVGVFVYRTRFMKKKDKAKK